MDRLDPALNRHELSTAEVQKIEIRWAGKSEATADELPPILNVKSDDSGECVAN